MLADHNKCGLGAKGSCEAYEEALDQEHLPKAAMLCKGKNEQASRGTGTCTDVKPLRKISEDSFGGCDWIRTLMPWRSHRAPDTAANEFIKAICSVPMKAIVDVDVSGRKVLL